MHYTCGPWCLFNAYVTYWLLQMQSWTKVYTGLFSDSKMAILKSSSYTCNSLLCIYRFMP
jgi:hypothetical protein